MILTVGSTIKDDKNNIYFLEEIIGQGGFGYVFRARRTNDDCALWREVTQNPTPAGNGRSAD